MTTTLGRSPLSDGIRNRIPQLSPVEAGVAHVLLVQGDSLIYQSASEIATLSGAALSTVVRTCKNLGFKGFQDLKLSLARENRVPAPGEIHSDISEDDRPRDILRKLQASGSAAVDFGVSHVDPHQFDLAVDALRTARTILCLGVGTSAPLAQDAAYRYMWLGRHAEAPNDVHVQHVRATLLGAQDAALVVSHTGSTRETVTAANAAHDRGATVITVTSYPRSPLTAVSDIVLVAASEETAYRVEALASRIAHLVVLDGLWVATALTLGEPALDCTRRIADVISEHRY